MEALQRQEKQQRWSVPTSMTSSIWPVSRGIFLDILDHLFRTVIDNLHVMGQVPQLRVSRVQMPHHRLSENPCRVKSEEFDEMPSTLCHQSGYAWWNVGQYSNHRLEVCFSWKNVVWRRQATKALHVLLLCV